jgi:hypothetical protein
VTAADEDGGKRDKDEDERQGGQKVWQLRVGHTAAVSCGSDSACTRLVMMHDKGESESTLRSEDRWVTRPDSRASVRSIIA